MRRAGFLLAAVVCGLASPAGAQDAGVKARVDEFAVQPAPEGTAVEQLGSERASSVQTDRPASDRSVAVSGAGAPPREPLHQISKPGEAGPTPQLSGAAQSRHVEAGSVSTPRDSRPDPVTRIAGRDRCDPGADAAHRAECRRIIELRADEYTATEAPKLSPEQTLLAAQAQLDNQSGASAVSQRARLGVSAGVDADVQSNQELAAIYLPNENTGETAATTDQAKAANDATVAAVMKVLQNGGTTSAAR